VLHGGAPVLQMPAATRPEAGELLVSKATPENKYDVWISEAEALLIFREGCNLILNEKKMCTGRVGKLTVLMTTAARSSDPYPAASNNTGHACG
jgi:hypothetical protein